MVRSQEAIDRKLREEGSWHATKILELLQLSGKNLMILGHHDTLHWCFSYLNVLLWFNWLILEKKKNQNDHALEGFCY